MVCEEIRLVTPTLGLKNEALEYRQEHFDFGEQVINGSELFDKITSYEEWLEKDDSHMEDLRQTIAGFKSYMVKTEKILSGKER